MNKSVVSALTAAALVMTSALAASAQTAETRVLPGETITGIQNHDLPTPPVHPSKFTLPINVKVAKDSNVTTNTPITDQYPSDYPRWGELISQCLKDKPVMVRVVEEESVPFIINKMEGKLKLNANDKPVCSPQ